MEEEAETRTNVWTERTRSDGFSLSHTHAGDPTLSQAALRSPSAAEGHFSTGPPTPECGAAGRRVQEGQSAPPHKACWQSPGNPACRGRK